jgi:hypothetical protein
VAQDEGLVFKPQCSKKKKEEENAFPLILTVFFLDKTITEELTEN